VGKKSKPSDEEVTHRPPRVLEQYTQQVARETVASKQSSRRGTRGVSIGTVAIRVGNLGEDWKGEFTRSLIKHEFLGDKKAIQKSLDAKQSHPE